MDNDQAILDQSAEHNSILQRFSRILKQGQLHPVHILAGREGLGKTSLARQLAALLLCDQQAFCGRCDSCLLFQAGRHPDFLEIKPEKSVIRVDDIAAILDFSSMHAMAKARVVVLPNVETLTKPAANRLLKTLEEPQSRIFFLMTTARLRAVIPTIRSRALISHVLPENFESYAAEQQEWLEIHAGSAGLLEQAQDLLDLWQTIVKGEPAATAFRKGLEALAKFLGEKESLPSISYIGEFVLNRMLRLMLERQGQGLELSRHWLACLAEYREVLDLIKQKELEQNIRLAEQMQLQGLLWRFIELDQLASAS